MTIHRGKRPTPPAPDKTRQIDPTSCLADPRDRRMKRLLIVYHTMTGGTRQMAAAAAEGAGSEEGVATQILAAGDAGPDDLLAADGYLFACPENLAAIAG